MDDRWALFFGGMMAGAFLHYAICLLIESYPKKAIQDHPFPVKKKLYVARRTIHEGQLLCIDDLAGGDEVYMVSVDGETGEILCACHECQQGRNNG